MVEIFGKPAVAAIIEKVSNGVNYILIQERYKASYPEEDESKFYPMNINALKKYVREKTK